MIFIEILAHPHVELFHVTTTIMLTQLALSKFNLKIKFIE